MKNFVTASWLFEHLDDSDVAILDCRFNLFDPAYGKNSYKKDHIKNAFFLDMNDDLSGEKREHGGFRPLPDLNVFKSKLEYIGIDNDTTIIIYDEYLDGAPRLWWFLKYLGHNNVYILNGGIEEWIKQGYTVTDEIAKPKKTGKYNIKINKDIYCDINYIKEKKAEENIILIDSRSYERYSGENEPLYDKAGHIPNAINHPWKNNLNDNFFKEKEYLEHDFEQIIKYEEIIFYCGSGIAACVNCLALDEIDEQSKVYIGSFTDWISYEENPIASI